MPHGSTLQGGGQQCPLPAAGEVWPAPGTVPGDGLSRRGTQASATPRLRPVCSGAVAGARCSCTCTWAGARRSTTGSFLCVTVTLINAFFPRDSSGAFISWSSEMSVSAAQVGALAPWAVSDGPERRSRQKQASHLLWGRWCSGEAPGRSHRCQRLEEPFLHSGVLVRRMCAPKSV